MPWVYGFLGTVIWASFVLYRGGFDGYQGVLLALGAAFAGICVARGEHADPAHGFAAAIIYLFLIGFGALALGKVGM